MLATILTRIPLVLVPLLPLPDSPRDCQLEVLTPQALEERTLGEFDRQVSAYVVLHRHLARSLPPLHMFPVFPDEEGTLVSDELRAALVVVRPQARQGGFFTPALGELLKRRLDDALLHGAGYAAMPMYEPLPGEPAPTVNQPFPFVLESVQWPALVRALPVIPRELEYAFWGRDLVLVDVAANLVIDVLPEALLEGSRPGVLYL
jgi:hypothetical protein